MRECANSQSTLCLFVCLIVSARDEGLTSESQVLLRQAFQSQPSVSTLFVSTPPVAADQARSEHSAADARLSTLNREITDIETYAGLDFGPDRALAALHKKCVSLEVRQYTYEVCFFDKVTQKEGYSSTSLGVWTKSDDVHREMRFENGQGCWNGPARSAQVSLSCGPPPADGAVARVLSVDEPSKCVYAIKVSTPAACLPELVEQTRKQMQDALAVDLRPKGHALKDEL